MKKFFFLVFLLFFFSEVFGFTWNLSGINLISRKQWGADSKYLYSDFSAYKQIILKQKNYMDYLKQNEQAYQTWLKKQKKQQTQENYLFKNWKSQIKTDKVIKYLNGKKLRWPIAYKYKKVSIIVHHTASDYRKFKNVNEVKKFIRGVYYYHAIKRGWGDIGYNFLIGPYGNIYEGRLGGDSVVGANSEWNNVSSIGIALIGNFDIQKPTKAQINALIKLSSVLAQKYHINPYSKVVYHESYWKYPYIKDVSNYALAGHKDTGHTRCPGKYLYALLPYVREQVYKAYLTAKSTFSTYKTKLVSYEIKTKKLNLGTKFVLTDKLVLKIPSVDFVKCKINNPNYQVSCKNNIITIEFKSFTNKVFDKILVEAFTSTTKYEISFKGVFMGNLRQIIKQQVEKKYYFKVQHIKKIKTKIYLTDFKNINQLSIRVLLYELTNNFLHYDFKCSKTCIIYTDKGQFTAKTFSLDKFDKLLLWINNKSISIKRLKIDSLGGFIKFTNYKRKSYAGIPWNFFGGRIAIRKDYVKNINTGKISYKYVVINELPLIDYLKGIAEGNDQMPVEKLKVMALLAKDYILFYYNKKNIHPSIPANSSYNAIDDPRIFQKYVGAGFEATSKKWSKILDFIKNKIVLYNGYIPILPYFSCSKGFTFSAYQKFGWIDTPYLQNSPDLGKCNKFYGHGVGLSGKGAEVLAQKGLNYRQILSWYFPGVYVETY